MRPRRNAAGTRGISGVRAFGWTDLANAVKKCVVVLARKVATQSAVRERDVLAAEVSCRSQKNSGRDDTGDERERAGRSFLVQRALRTEHQQPLHEIRG